MNKSSKKGINIFFVIVLIAIAFAYFSNSDNKNERLITKEEFGEKWAFTVDKAILKCIDGQSIVIIVDEKIYGLNGVAKMWGEKLGYYDIDEIWLENLELKESLMKSGVSEKDATSGMNIGPFLDAGLKLCE